MRKFNAFRHFVNTYVDKHYKIDEGKIKISKSDGYKHNIRVCEICCKLIQEKNIKFITQCRLKGGSIPDIVFFRGNIPYVVEVRNTENDRRSKKKIEKLPYELREFVVYIDANKPLNKEISKMR